MKRKNAILALALMALVVIWALPGCKTPASDTIDNDLLTREQVVDLDDEYGGYNLGDESEAFSDPSLTTDYGPESSVAFDDPMDADPEVRDVMARPHRQRFLMITWGNLHADTSITFTTDWSGGLSVENGIVLLKRTILFDPRDEILPRTSRDLLEWNSFTRPHFDGIVVALHKRHVRCDSLPNDSTVVNTRDTVRCETPPLAVTFKTGPLTVTITEDDLEDLHRVVQVDDAGNAVAFNTIVIEPQACAGGFLAGQWKNVSDRPGGIFRGKWISHNGVHMGYLRGAYGPNSRGQKVFFGKWIAAGGNFQGLLRGRYGDFDVRPGGWFEGEWLTRNLRIGGGLRGVWGTSDRIDGGGFFRGSWRQRCNAVGLN